MNYEMLEKVICDTIKEEQIKLGYERETIRLYYPMSSLINLIEVDIKDKEQLNEALALFADQVKDKLGKLIISYKEDRYCILIPPEGAAYVHENIMDNPFLLDFIAAIRNHDCTIEQLLTVFHTYSNRVECVKSEIEDFDYVIYFADEKLDEYRYCIKFEHGHAIYHRFTKVDYEHLDVSASEGINELEEVVDEETELVYVRLLKLMKAVKCMTACNEKLAMYKQLTKQFAGISGYKAAAENAEECKMLGKQVKKAIKKKLYNAALKLKEEARTAEDFKEAGEKFRNISGYKDTDDLALECEVLSNRMEKRYVRNRVLKLCIIVLCISFALITAFIPQTRYYLGRLTQLSGAYENAIELYQKANGYGDSEERLNQSRYQNGMKLMSKQQYGAAVKYFNAAGEYLDSDSKMVEAEQLKIKSSKPGDTVMIGNQKWLILELTEHQALLMKKDSISAMPYHDIREEISWEGSTLRQWLNTEYINNSFSNEEKNNMLLSEIANEDNSVYHTKGGNNTQDIIFMLSINEALKYQSLFPDFKSNTWLRSPGSHQDSAAFLSVNGSVMDYGYDVSSSELKVRPVMWFSITD